MWKLIFICVVIWIVFLLVKRGMRQSSSRNSDQANGQKQEISEDMVECKTCAVHLPRSEAFLVAGNFYCSKNHIKTE